MTKGVVYLTSCLSYVYEIEIVMDMKFYKMLTNRIVAVATVVLALTCGAALGQGVGINEDNSDPDASAMLDVKSSTKGILIPRMTSSERTAISSPAKGLLVFDNDDSSFWFFTGAIWQQIGAGTGTDDQQISITGSVITLEDGGSIDIGTVDTDNQQLTLAGTILEIEDGNTVDLAAINTDGQLLSYNSTTGELAISDGNSIVLPISTGGDNWGSQAVVTDATLTGNGTSGDPLTVSGDLTDDQTLSFNSSTGSLTISEGNTITLPVSTGGDNWGSQIAETDGITITGDGTSANPLEVNGDLTDDQDISLSGTQLSITDGSTIDLSGIDTDTDDQTLSLTGTDLSIADGNTVDLSSLQDGTGTDDQVVDAFFLNGKNLELSLADDGEANKIVDLSSLDTDTDDQQLSLAGTSLTIEDGNTIDLAAIDTDTDTDDQTLSLTGTDLSIADGNTVDLSSLQDGAGTDDQQLSLTGTSLTIEDGNTVDLAAIDTDTDTDDQTLTLTGTDLSIADGNTVDLSSINATDDMIADADADTKIQVEETANEDYIRFDVAGVEAMVIDSTGNVGIGSEPTEKFQVDGNIRIEQSNTKTGNSGTLAESGSEIKALDFYYSGGTATDVISKIATKNYNTIGTGWYNLTGRYDAGLSFYVANNNSLSEALTINNLGNVGIGTTGPQEELHVAGNIRMVDGNQGAGKVMVSDANGTATWTDATSLSRDEISDADNDTKIQVEETADEDIIRFDVAGSEVMTIGNDGNLLLERTATYGETKTLTLAGAGAIGSAIYGKIAFNNYDGSSGSFDYEGAAITARNLGSANNGALSFWTRDAALTEWVRLTKDGALQIDPDGATGASLIVNGSFTLNNGSQADGYVLTSSGTGSATWQDPTTLSIDTDDQTLSLSGTSLTIADGNTIDLSSVDTDNQVIDVFQLSGTNLEISLEDDGEATKSIDLSFLNSVGDEISDADGNTKIQVEESADEDVIRFDVAGTEAMVIDNSGNVGVGVSAPSSRFEVNLGTSTSESLSVEQSSGISYFTGGTTEAWQSFTAAVSGELTKVSLKHFTITTPDNKYIKIIEGEGAGGTVLYTSPSTIEVSSSGWYDFTVSGVDLVAGQQYTIWLDDKRKWIVEDSDAYTGGRTGHNAAYDHAFRVYVMADNGGFKIGDNLVMINDYSMPISDGAADQVLTTNGAGSLGWTTLTDTDDQTLSLSGTNLTITDGNTIDISSVNSVQDIIQDADADTKIQVEQSADEDIIRFTVNGSEQLRMEDDRLQLAGTNNNTFVGSSAGNGSITGYRNSGFGVSALTSLSSGRFNTAIGYGALTSLTSGQYNTAIGYQALTTISTSVSNTALGTDALGSAEGSYNTGIGHLAAEDITGDLNVAIGNSAMRYADSGNSVAIGNVAGQNSSGNSNVFLGYEAGRYASGGGGNIFLGNQAGMNETGSNKLYIENSSSSTPLIYGEFDNDMVKVNGSLGVGSEPTEKLQVDGNIRIEQSSTTTGNSGTLAESGSEIKALDFYYSGGTATDVISKIATKNYNTSGSGWYNLTDRYDAGLSFYVANNNTLSEALTINNEGKVGIGTTSPSKALLEVNGGEVANSSDHSAYWSSKFGYLNGSGSSGSSSAPLSNYTITYSIWASDRIASSEFNAFSDRRIKNIKGISDPEEDLSALMKLEITNYTMRDSLRLGNKVHKKVIAQQVDEAYPQAVSKDIKRFIPDIYQHANVDEAGWINLPADLMAGDRVKLIFKPGEEGHSQKEVIVEEVSENGFRIAGVMATEVFVYGKEVEDFHLVDYEALTTLNISATQAQQKRIEKLEQENAVLKAQLSEVAGLKAQVEQLKSTEARLEKIEAMLNATASATNATEK